MTAPAEPTRAGAGRRALRAAIWLPGLAVAVGAAVATAHGLYEVAVAARVPVGVAWLYPLITDGLALVAYAATAQLGGTGRRYAWSVVVLAAGLSGLAQAAYLAGDAAVAAPAVLRFGVGAWPAIAAAIVAHLLYLLATDDSPNRAIAADGDNAAAVGLPAVRSTRGVPPQLPAAAVVPPAEAPPAVPPAAQRDGAAVRSTPSTASAAQRPTGASDRARVAAVRYAARHGDLPTASDLEALAGVSRGTAGRALKALREHALPLHLVTDNPDTRTNR